MKRNKSYYLRKAHRWLGVIIGVQFIFWTVSGLYFSWTDIDEIHGDHFRKEPPARSISFPSNGEVNIGEEVNRIALRFIGDESYFWINNSYLVHTVTGERKEDVTEEEALLIAQDHIKQSYKVKEVSLLTDTDKHHEFRERPLPAWKIDYEGDAALTAYIGEKGGSFQRVRHRDWRWFDFLWMTHTMDYESRDNMNNWLLRAFSVFGLLTVLSGFMLFFFTTKVGAKMIR